MRMVSVMRRGNPRGSGRLQTENRWRRSPRFQGTGMSGPMHFLANILAGHAFDRLAIYQRDTALAARMKSERLESVVWFAQEEVRRLEGDLEATTARAIEEYHAGIRNNTLRAERSGLSGNNKSPLARASVSKMEPGAGVARAEQIKSPYQ